jgi:hypothetical protein
MKRHLSFVAALGMGFFASITPAYAQVRADTGSIATRLMTARGHEAKNSM